MIHYRKPTILQTKGSVSVMYRELQKVGSGKGSTGFRTFDPN